MALATMFRLVLCFMIILFSLDPRTQHFKFTTLSMSDPTAASCSLLSSLLPCHCASRLQGLPHTCSFKFIPHLCRTGQLISNLFHICAELGSSFQLFTPHFCRTGQQSLWGISLAWLKSMKKSRRVSNGSEPESPLAGVNQELAGMALKREISFFFV